MKRSPLTTALLTSALFLTSGVLAHGQGLTYERWTGVPSTSILMLQRSAVNVRVADSTQTVNLAEIPSNAADSYGGRLRGWVTAPQTGDYTFFVAGDDSAELWLSPDSSRFNRQLIAFNRNPTASRQWNKFASQRSKTIRLVQGQAYYLEAWMKESTSSDHLAVGWHRVDVPSYTSANWASATGTWTETAAGGQAFSIASGGLGGTSDSASRVIRPWTGDGEFVVNLEQLAGSSNTAQAGLMLRVDPAANGRHVFIGRNVAGQSSYVRRTTLGGSTSTTLGSLSGKFLRLIRSGNIISASVSADGVQWVSAGTSVTFTSLPATLEVSLVAAAVTANPATPVTGTFSQWVARPLNATEVIPGTALTPNAADAADTGDKTIPDAWQIVNGLVPSERFGANGPYGDPDQDGLPNWLEFSYDFNPYEADSINGLITRELWVNIPGINQVVDLTNHNRFFETPDAIDLVSGVDFYFGGELTNSFGARYRGEITAPKTGYFRFWITAPDDAQLWMADGSIKRPGDSLGLSSRFGKRKIASVWGTGYFTSRSARYNYDAFACQQSEPVWLAQGQKYFFEVLHKTRSHEMNHVSVAWQPPGESRTLIPAAAYSHHLPSLDDADDDYLPNTWESIFGLNPTLNGRTDRRQAQNGDYDADTLSNLREYQLGTNPTNADTDGDGLRDDFELLSGLDPANPTTLAGVPDKWLATYFPDLLASGLQGFNPSADSDGDSLSNFDEAQRATNPNNVDTDGDGQNDNVDSAPLTAAEYGLVNPTFDATPTPSNPIRRWPAAGPATASLYPHDSILGWRAHTNTVIELRHETATDNIVELHAHWPDDSTETETGHGVTQSFEMLPGTTRTYILRYKGRASTATDTADNEFSLKLTGGTLKVDGNAVPTGEKSYSGTVDEFKYSVIEFAVPAGSAALGQAPAQAMTVEITPSQNADTNTYGAWIDLLPFDIAVDTNRDGTVNSASDQRDENLWTTQRGAIYNVNFDRDGDNSSGPENRPDAIHFDDSGTGTDEDYQIENAADEEDIAPLVIKPLQTLPADYKVVLKVEEEEDFRAIHLFKRIQPGEDAIWGSYQDPASAPWAVNDDDLADLEIDISKWINPNATGYEETRDDPDNDDYTLGIEGLVLRGMDVSGGSLKDETSNPFHAGKFSGEIAITLEIRDSGDAVVGSQTVRLRVAPWLMISRDESSEEVWAVDFGQENADFRSTALNGNYAGIGHSGQLELVGDDPAELAQLEGQWLQDNIEIGFTQRPGGPKTHLVFRLPYGVQPSWSIYQLLKENVGIFQLKNTFGMGSGDFGGNLEVLAPNSDHPLGLATLGDAASEDIKAFIEAQEFQALEWPNTPASRWLKVGHVDEYTSFLSGGRVLIAGARQALELLESEIPVADRAKRVFFATSSENRIGTVTQTAVDDPATLDIDESVRIIHTGIDHLTEGVDYRWIRFYSGNAKGHVARVKMHNQFLEVESIPGSTPPVPAIFYTGQSIDEYEHWAERGGVPDLFGVENFRWLTSPAAGDSFVLVKDSRFWSDTLSLGIDYEGDGVSEGMPAFITVKEVLEDEGPDNFVQFNRFDVEGVLVEAQQYIRANSGSTAPHFIEVPNLFFGIDLPPGSPGAWTGVSDSSSVAFNPGPTNCQPLAGNIYAPRQFGPRNSAGTDFFELTIKNAVQEPVYFTDCWDLYHRRMGEVHCGSIVKRALPTWNWWEKINE